jgi:hypothetical protein
MLREKNRSRPALFTIAATGLVLMNLSDFFALNNHQRSACDVIGNLLFIAALLKFTPALNTKSESPDPANQLAAAASCLAFGSLLLLSRFLHTSLWLHGLIDMAAGGLLIVSLSLPLSRWTQLTFVPIMAVALLQIKWKTFSAFTLIRPPILIAMVAAWALFSFFTFRFLDRRKSEPAVELH